MSPTFEDLQAEIMGIVLSVWPEIPSPETNDPDSDPLQFFTAIQALRNSFVEAIENGRLALPCCILEIGRFTPDLDIGARGPHYRARVAIHYVANVSDSFDQPQIDEKLWQMATAIDFTATDYVTFQAPRERAVVDSSPSSPVNAAIAEKAKVPVVAGHVVWEPGLLVTRDFS